MKTFMLPFALATLAVSALAGAQTPPSSSDTSAAPPSSTQAPSSSSSSAMSSSDKAWMKDCVAKQKASNPQISETDAKSACAKSQPK